MKKTIIELYGKYKNDDVSESAAQLTYYLILAIFPFIISLLQIVKFTPLGDADVVEKLLVSFPLQTQELLMGIIKDVVSSSGKTLLSIGIIGSIWSASNGIMSLIKAVNKAYDLSESRPYWKLKLLSVIMTVGLILIIIITLGLGIFEALVFNKYIALNFPNTEFLFTILQGFLSLVSIILILTLLYKFSPSLKENINISFKESLPGGVFTTIFLLVSTKAFSIYVDNFGNYSKVYGSIGGIIVLLIWLYLSSNLLILGAELNSIFMNRKKDQPGNAELRQDEKQQRKSDLNGRIKQQEMPELNWQVEKTIEEND